MSEQQFQIQQSDEIIRSELLKTLEYYFSSKNLSKDDYLISQMDDDYYVPLDEIAKFNKIKNLTNDINVIKEVIKQSSQLELDPDTNNKVRSINGKLGGTFQTKLTNKQIIQTPPPPPSTSSSSLQQQQRSVLILREVSPEATYEKIIQLFENKEPLCPACEKCESAGNDSWYVTFCNEDQAQRALQYLKGEVQFFMDRPIKARIKAHAMPRSNTSGIGFNQMNLTPSSTPPPPSLSQPPTQLHNATPIQLPLSPHNNNNNNNPTFIQPQVYTPTIAFIPAPQFNQINSPSNQAASIIIQANHHHHHPHHPGYEYAPAIFQPPNWPTQTILQSNSNVYIASDINQPINSVSPSSIPIEDKSQIENQNLNTSSSNGSVQSSPSTLIISNTNSPKSVNTLNQFVSNSQNNFSKTAPNYAFHAINASPSNSPALISQYPNYNPTNHHTILTNQNHAHYTAAPNLPHGHFIIQANLNHHHQQHNFHNSNNNNNNITNNQSSGNNHHPTTHTLNQQYYQPGNFNHFANQSHFSSLNINTPSNLSFEVDQKSFNHQIQVPITLPFHTGQQNNSFGSNQPNQPTAPAFAFFYNPSLPPHPIQPSSNPNIIFNPILPSTQQPNQQIGLVQSNSNQTSSSNNNNSNSNTVQFPSSSSSLSSSPKPSTNNNNTQQPNQRRPNNSVDSSKNNNNNNTNQSSQKYTGQRSKFNNQSTHSSSSITMNNNNNTTLNRNHNNYQNSTNTHYQHSYTNNLNFYESNSSSGISTSSALSSQSNTPIQQNNNFNKNNHLEHNNVQTDDSIKRNKSPLIINSDLSFPPLNSSSSSSSSSASSTSSSSSSSTASSMTPSTNNSKNVTISLQNLPVNKQKNENQEAPIDPAIISCYKSADFIPNSPTIIKSNTIIDSKSHDSKKATSETLANILNQTNEYKNSSEKHFINNSNNNNNNNSFHQRNKYESYQRNPRINSSNRNSNNMKKVSNDSNRHMRVSNSNQNINSDQYHDHNMRRKNYDSRHNNKNLNSENTQKISISISANEQLSFMNSPSAPSTPGQGNEEEIVNCLNSCWNKKLTFAEIVQKAGSSASPSPTLMNKLNNTDTNEIHLENALEYNSSLNQTIITTD